MAADWLTINWIQKESHDSSWCSRSCKEGMLLIVQA